MRLKTGWTTFLGALLTAGLPACMTRVDMATAYEATTTPPVTPTPIAYVGVRDASRQYADYSAIRADVLVPKTRPKEKR